MAYFLSVAYGSYFLRFFDVTNLSRICKFSYFVLNSCETFVAKTGMWRQNSEHAFRIRRKFEPGFILTFFFYWSILLCLIQQVPIILPFIFILCALFVVAVSIYSSPIDCGIGALITLSGVPVYFVFARWQGKPAWFTRTFGNNFI